MNFSSEVFNLNEKDNVKYLTFKSLEKYNFINHAFSTKFSGVSKGDFASMNLGFNGVDSSENVIKNYHIFCDAVGFEFESLVASSQDHHTNIRCVETKDRGIGIYRPKDLLSVDGLLTDKKGITLVTYYADCTPIFYLDPKKKVIGLAHAGWRGTVLGIAPKMIKTMSERYGCEPADIICCIGPAIGKCCYEVDKPVYEKFANINNIDISEIADDVGGGKYMIDLWETNKRRLMLAGVREENIFVGDICTKCNSDLLFSHRATNGKRGTLAAMMCIKGEE